ncbi:MAG: glycosyltransferase family 2 protein [Egibacteraceae bacterium]
MRLSIIIPCRNGARLLENVLAGIVTQDIATTDVEVILVDNNSDTDSIERVYRDFRDLLTLTLIQQPRLAHPFALSRARNTALRLAAGEWISSIDADCIPSSGFLRSIYAAIDQAGSRSRIFAGERIFISAGNLTKEKLIDQPSILLHVPRVPSASNYFLSKDRRLPTMEQLPDVKHPWAYMHGGNLLYRTIDAKLVHGHDERFDGSWGYEDADFAYRMITTASCSPRYLPAMTVYHQEPLTSPDMQVDRFDKKNNPNWRRVCEAIPGFQAFKIDQYKRLGISVSI